MPDLILLGARAHVTRTVSKDWTADVRAALQLVVCDRTKTPHSRAPVEVGRSALAALAEHRRVPAEKTRARRLLFGAEVVGSPPASASAHRVDVTCSAGLPGAALAPHSVTRWLDANTPRRTVADGGPADATGSRGDDLGRTTTTSLKVRSTRTFTTTGWRPAKGSRDGTE